MRSTGSEHGVAGLLPQTSGIRITLTYSRRRVLVPSRMFYGKVGTAWLWDHDFGECARLMLQGRVVPFRLLRFQRVNRIDGSSAGSR